MKMMGGNIIIVLNMEAYKLRVMHNEDYTLTFSLIRYNISLYPREKATVVMTPL